METNERSVLACERESELVAYLYAEAAPAEREGFESHLLECPACTDEFAQLSEARYSVFEWQREEFEPLATPKFVIPYPEPAKVGIAGAVRAFLSLATPRLAVAAVLISLLLGVGIWFSRTGAIDGQQTASGGGPATIVTPLPERESKKDTDPSPAVSTNGDSLGASTPPRRHIAARTIAPKPGSRAVTPHVRPKTLIDGGQTVAIAQKKIKPLPSLTDVADDEDDSLRLSDLFEAIGN